MSRIGVAVPTSNPEAYVDADLDTLATALYARTDDLLKASPEQRSNCQDLWIDLVRPRSRRVA